jgi:uncharacterized protein
MTFPWGHDQRYNDFGKYMRQRFKGRVQKLSLNAGFTCPNRDGNISTGGCSFCNNETFKPSYCQPLTTVADQIKERHWFFSQPLSGYTIFSLFPGLHQYLR